MLVYSKSLRFFGPFLRNTSSTVIEFPVLKSEQWDKPANGERAATNRETRNREDEKEEQRKTKKTRERKMEKYEGDSSLISEPIMRGT